MTKSLDVSSWGVLLQATVRAIQYVLNAVGTPVYEQLVTSRNSGSCFVTHCC